jgi:hypothetical protein
MWCHNGWEIKYPLGFHKLQYSYIYNYKPKHHLPLFPTNALPDSARAIMLVRSYNDMTHVMKPFPNKIYKSGGEPVTCPRRLGWVLNDRPLQELKEEYHG